MTRRKLTGAERPRRRASAARTLENVAVELGAEGNPPGFDAELVGLEPGEAKTFTITFPADYPVGIAGRRRGRVRSDGRRHAAQGAAGARRRVLEGSRLRVARRAAARRCGSGCSARPDGRSEREVRQDLLRQLARRVTATRPRAWWTREVDRRVEEFVHQLVEQGVDPRQVEGRLGRDAQGPARAGRGDGQVRARARRDCPARGPEGGGRGDRRGDRALCRAERTPARETVRARLVKEGAISRIYTGLRREKAIDYALGRATIVDI